MGGITQLSGIGVNQTWQLVTRSFSTTYTNTTSKPIQCSVSAWTASPSIDCRLILNGSAGVILGYTPVAVSGVARGIFNFIVPPNATYELQMAGANLDSWAELR